MNRPTREQLAIALSWGEKTGGMYAAWLAAEVRALQELVATGDFKDLYAEGIEMGKRIEAARRDGTTL